MVSADGVVFDPERAITRAEAAVLLDRMLQVTDAAVTTMYTDLDVAPAWACRQRSTWRPPEFSRPMPTAPSPSPIP